MTALRAKTDCKRVKKLFILSFPCPCFLASRGLQNQGER